MLQSCRICSNMEDKNMLYLSSQRGGLTMAEIINEISGIKVQSNYLGLVSSRSLNESYIRMSKELPQKICADCTKQVLAASKIKSKILETELFLNKTIESKIKSNNEDSTRICEDFSFRNSFEQVTIIDQKVVRDDLKILTKLDTTIAKTRLQSHKPTPLEDRKNKAPNELDYKCFLCDKTFSKISTKNSHVKSTHENERNCKLCRTKCKTALSLETHIKFHYQDYSFMCEICSKTFRYRNRLNNHMELHHARPTEMLCDLCGLSSKFKNNIKRHMRSVHMKLREFQCDRCAGHQYSTQEGLNSHLYRHHNVPAPISCSECSHGFTFDSELRAHKKHGICSSFSSSPSAKRNLKLHENLEILDSGEHRCKICNESFPNKNKWSMHNYLKHKYSNRCDQCNLSFTNYTSLVRHQKVKHEGRKPFECEFCYKTFGQKVSLMSHRNTHTGQKTFNCLFCTFRSGDHGTISKHKKKMHPETMAVSRSQLQKSNK